MSPLVILAISVVVAIVVFLRVLAVNADQDQAEYNPFEKKPFVFDALYELTVYRHLVELFGDRYYVFPQMVYSRLMQQKRGEGLYHRVHFDRKIADFVLCDKEKAVAQLVVELDGPSHNSEKRVERDDKVDTMMRLVGLPILHLKTDNLDKDYIKGEIEKALATK